MLGISFKVRHLAKGIFVNDIPLTKQRLYYHIKRISLSDINNTIVLHSSIGMPHKPIATESCQKTYDNNKQATDFNDFLHVALFFVSEIEHIIIHIPVRIISLMDIFPLTVDIYMEVLIQFQHMLEIFLFIFNGII